MPTGQYTRTKEMYKTRMGSVPWNLGVSPSEESRLKMRNAHLGKKLSEETKSKMSLIHSGNKYNLGKTIPSDVRQKMSVAHKGVKAYQWKGDNVSIEGLHHRVKVEFGIANKCENPECTYPRKNKRGEMMAKPKRYEWANISKRYIRDVKDFVQLCPSCHRQWDLGIISINFK